MPTAGERRALIFIAGIASLGVVARGWQAVRGDRGTDQGVGDRAGLSRQIAAVDSAIAAGGAKRSARPERVRKDGENGRLSASNSVEEPPEHPEMPPEYPPRARFPKSWSAPRLSVDGERGAVVNRDRTESARLPAPGHHRADADRPTEPTGVSRRPATQPVKPPVDLDIAPLDDIASVPQIGAGLARQIVQDRIDHGPFGSIDGLRRIPGISPGLAHRLQPYVTFSLGPQFGGVPETRSAGQKARRPRG